MNTSTVIRGSSRHHNARISETSITEGSIWKALLAFFFPILFGTVFQQLYNTVDAIVVGRFVGKEALAAVGGGSGVYVNLLVGFFCRAYKWRRCHHIAVLRCKEYARHFSPPWHTSLALSICGGIVLSVLGNYLQANR